MTLRPTDMMVIQSAIDDYERRYPRRPTPSAQVALEWRIGKRAASKILAEEPQPVAAASEKRLRKDDFEDQECSRLEWMQEKLRLRWNMSRGLRLDDAAVDGPSGFAAGVMRVGWWGMVAVLTASVFWLGAIIGGLK